MTQQDYKQRLQNLLKKPENQICSDCSERQPRWASLLVPPPGSPTGSLPMGALCCLECSGSHRRLGTHISFVRSVNLDQWKEKEILAMENGGNKKINNIYECHLDPNLKLVKFSSGLLRERFIRDKYEKRKYMNVELLMQYYEISDIVVSPKCKESIFSTYNNGKNNNTNLSSVKQDDKNSKKTTKTIPKLPMRLPSQAAKQRVKDRREKLNKNKPSKYFSPKSTANTPSSDINLLEFGLTNNDINESLPKPSSSTPYRTLDSFQDIQWICASNVVTDDGKEEEQEKKKNNKHKPKLSNEDILKMFHSNNKETYNMSKVMNNESSMSDIVCCSTISNVDNIFDMQNMKGDNITGGSSNMQNMNNLMDGGVSISSSIKTMNPKKYMTDRNTMNNINKSNSTYNTPLTVKKPPTVDQMADDVMANIMNLYPSTKGIGNRMS